MDDDLKHLLDQLNPEARKPSQKPLPRTEFDDVADPGVVWVDDVIDPSELNIVVSESNETVDILPVPTDTRRIDTTDTTTVDIAPVLPQSPLVDVRKYFDRLDGVTDEILNACRSDRQETQDVISMLRHEIEQSLNQNKDPARMFVDGLVKAIEVKANINMTAVKMMEANSKMLAAIKASTNVQVNNQQVNLGGDHDLERVLDEPLTIDDEY